MTLSVKDSGFSISFIYSTTYPFCLRLASQIDSSVRQVEIASMSTVALYWETAKYL